MRVLYIINSLGTGGAEKLVVDILPILKKRGVDVELLVINKVESIFEDALVDMKITYSPFSLNSPKNILFIKKFIKNFDIVHVHLFPSQYWAALTFSKIPMVVTEHCTFNKRREKVIYRPIEQLTYGRFKRIVSISNKANEAIQKWLRFKENKFVIIENGINLKSFYEAKPIPLNYLPKNSKKIIMVGRFNPTKDQPTAIRAMKHLAKDVHLILVGEGNLTTECENLAKSLEVDERVHFFGLRKDIPQLLKSCDINLISSHSEGLSISSLEALASGRPLVASNVNGLREINKDAGLLFEDNDEKDLANCVNQLLNDAAFYEKISKRCLERVKSYDIDNTVSEHLALYNEILSE